MKNSFQISIPKPCHENWDAFKPTPTGGYCMSCQKNVRDFTKMTDTELIAFFRDISKKENKSLCGRFRENQLEKIFSVEQWFPDWIVENNQISYEVSVEKLKSRPMKISVPSIFRNKIFGNTVVAALILSLAANAQTKKVSGKVTAFEDGLGLPGVSIQVVGTTKGVATNENGEYSIEADENATLRFSFVGFETKELSVKDKMDVSLEMSTIMLSGMVFVGEVIPVRKEFTGGISMVSQKSFFEMETLKILQPQKLILYPNIAQSDEVFLRPEPLEIENDKEKTAFAEIENLMVYDYFTGKNHEIEYEIQTNGELKLNISKIPDGLYVVRVSQKNLEDVEKPIISFARLVVEK